jgi:hypothetical protein
VPALRSFLRDHRSIAACLIALALAMKALVPAGYMLGTAAHVLTVEVCADGQGKRLTRQIVVPGESKPADHAKPDGTCAWSGLSLAALGGADAVLLALALAFILLLGLVRPAPPLLSRAVHLRPPLRGPPSFA